MPLTNADQKIDQTPSRVSRTIHVLVATPLGHGGQGGIDRIMDGVRTQLEREPAPDVSVTFLTTRGQKHILFSFFFLTAAIIRLCVLRFAKKADILHINLSSHGSTQRKLILSRVARFLRVPYVIHLHGSRFRRYFDGLSESRKDCVCGMFVNAAKIIVLGGIWKIFVAERVPSAFERIEIAPNASRGPVKIFKPVETPVTILFLGHVGPRKGVPQLIDAFERLKIRNGWRGVIAGNGEVEATRTVLEKKGLSDRVHLTGWVDTAAVDRLLLEAHILVLPSFDENLPMSVIEGMAYGLAVIATPVGAVEDIITDGVSGLLVPVGDSEKLAEAIERLLVDPDLRERLGSTAATFHKSELDIAPYTRRLCQLWRSVALATSQTPI